LRNALREFGLINLSTVLYKSLHALLFGDIGLPVFMISPRLASEAGSKVSSMARQLLDTMAPVIPTGRCLVFTSAVEFGTSFIDKQDAPAVD
jgi:hypothetical protein